MMDIGFEDEFYTWDLGRRAILLDVPKFMGIWNVSPDSFSSAPGDDAHDHAKELVATGADILDVGAESTRPGSTPIDSSEEIRRLAPMLEWARSKFDIPISLDSYHPETIEWALANGLVDIINDVALCQTPTRERDGRIYGAVAKYNAGLVIMAWNPFDAPILRLPECVAMIHSQLEMRMALALDGYGIPAERIVVDPGIGFGKGAENDISLIRFSGIYFQDIGRPVLVAHSRKRCLSHMTGLPTSELDVPTAITAAISLAGGAMIVRVHNVAMARAAYATIRQCPGAGLFLDDFYKYHEQYVRKN